MNITKQQYEYALRRIEELLPVVTDEMPMTDDRVVELTMISDIVEAYEKEHYPIGKPSVGDLIRLAVEDKGISQRQLAAQIFLILSGEGFLSIFEFFRAAGCVCWKKMINL